MVVPFVMPDSLGEMDSEFRTTFCCPVIDQPLLCKSRYEHLPQQSRQTSLPHRAPQFAEDVFERRQHGHLISQPGQPEGFQAGLFVQDRVLKSLSLLASKCELLADRPEEGR
jgi:hypothetical protein